jgi:hypothetical protein
MWSRTTATPISRSRTVQDHDEGSRSMRNPHSAVGEDSWRLRLSRFVAEVDEAMAKVWLQSDQTVVVLLPW